MTPEDILSLFNERPVDSSNFSLSQTNFVELCPILIQQLDQHFCPTVLAKSLEHHQDIHHLHDHDDDDHDNHHDHSYDHDEEGNENITEALASGLFSASAKGESCVHVGNILLGFFTNV